MDPEEEESLSPFRDEARNRDYGTVTRRASRAIFSHDLSFRREFMEDAMLDATPESSVHMCNRVMLYIFLEGHSMGTESLIRWMFG